MFINEFNPIEHFIHKTLKKNAHFDYTLVRDFLLLALSFILIGSNEKIVYSLTYVI